MGRILVLVYGVIAYVIFFAAFLAAIGFVEGIDPLGLGWTLRGVGTAWMPALLVNMALLGAFAIQHSVMARPAFKARWTRIVSPAVERSTYVLLSSLILFAIVSEWRPLPGQVWDVREAALAPVLTGLSWVGWATVLVSTFLIGHFELFGLAQVWRHFRQQPAPQHRFREPGLYRYVRHPIMLGFLLAFWATPYMTMGHLLFAAVTTAYVLVAIQIEERDLLAAHGDDYRAYRRRVSMLLPLPRSRS